MQETTDAPSDPATPPHADCGAATLVVLLHAYTGSPAGLQSVRRAIEAHWPEAELLVPSLPLGLFSTARLDDVVGQVLQAVDARVDAARRAGRRQDRIVLVGHSMGALLARKAYVAACGETLGAPFEPGIAAVGRRGPGGLIEPREWAGAVTRIVLLAGMNRGWRITHHLGLGKAITWTLGSALQQAARLVGRSFAIFGIRRGGGFITQLRVQWLRMRQAWQQAGARGPGGALTVQLLGSRDDMVAPEDNVDLVSGGDFRYLDVPYSGHADVVDFSDPQHGRGRRDIFLFALTAPPAALEQAAVMPSDEQFVQPDREVQQVLFVIHGIRDVGYWTHKIARRVKQRAGADSRRWATETSSYGYFPMLPFLFPWTRRQKVEWLMDQYAEALARFPHAEFNYIGHSNGTYLLAKALELYPCCQFRHVTFAGSVVSHRYDWQRALSGQPPQVQAVLNFTASGDWVVAWFPKLFQLLRLQDLGSAGHDGFAQARRSDRVFDRGHVSGGHSAALDESLWDVIADFTLGGRPPPDRLPGMQPRQRWWVRLPGHFPPLVWAVLAVGAVAGWWGLMNGVASLPLAGETAIGFARGVATGLYLLAIWLVITRL